MKSIPLRFVVILLLLRIIRCQRFTGNEMLTSLKNVINATKFIETEECLPAMEGKLYPGVAYLYMSCDTNQDQIPLRNFPSETQCSGFQCWESQLTDSSRFDILRVMNMYRTTIAEGTCGPRCENEYLKIIFELKWHNKLERKAIEFTADCKNEKNSSDSDEILYNDNRARLDYVSVSFQVKEGRQRELRLILRKLLEENYLNDWNESTKRFRRHLFINVGCAYVLRYGVTMVTSLNENVNSGNVGHLCCVFSSPFSYNPSKGATCASFMPGFNVEEPSKNHLHPSLCKVVVPSSSITTPTTSCQFDEKFHDEIFDNICPQGSSSQHHITWDEKPYGFFLKFRVEPNAQNELFGTLQDVECNVPKVPSLSQDQKTEHYNYDCTYKQEVINEADPITCQGWSCDESQLTDDSKYLILRSVNKDRELVAEGKCTALCLPPCYCRSIQYCDMAELRWHWYLEWKASEKVKNCPTENSFHRVTFRNTPFPEPVYFEEVTLVFDLPFQGQIALADRFKQFFWTNALNDWAANGKFRRGSAVWMGCAIVVRPGHTIDMPLEFKLPDGIPTHMVCIYASLEKDFDSTPGFANTSCCPTCTESSVAVTCNINMAKGLKPYPHLCSSTALLQITMSCNINKCKKTDKSLTFLSAWKVNLPGFTLTQKVNGDLEYTYRPSADELTDRRLAIKMCKIVFLLFGIVASMMLLLSSLLYKHNLEKKYYSILRKKQKG